MMRKNNQTILPETNIKLYINYASVFKKKKKPIKGLIQRLDFQSIKIKKL